MINILRNTLSKRSVRVSLLLIVLSLFVYEEQRVQAKLKNSTLKISESCNLSNIVNNYDVEINATEDYVKLISLHNKNYTDNLNLLKESNSESCLLDIYNGYLRLAEGKINKCYIEYGTNCSLKKVSLIPVEDFLKLPNFSIYKMKYYTRLEAKYNKLKGEVSND